MQERKDRAQRDAEDAAQPRKTIESEVKKATNWMETNRLIEDARMMISSYRAKYHSDTFRFRSAATKVLNDAIAKDKTIGGIASAISEIKALSHKHYRD